MTLGTIDTWPFVWSGAENAMTPFTSPRTALPMRRVLVLVVLTCVLVVFVVVWLGTDSIGRHAVEAIAATSAGTTIDLLTE